MARSDKFWAKVRAAYRRGEGSIAELAVRFEVPQSTLEKRACKEKWTQQKQETGKRAEEKAVERDIDVRAAAIGDAKALVDGVVSKAKATLSAVDLFDPDGLKQVSATVSQMLPFLLKLAGVDPERPIAESGAAAKQRVLVRGGAALQPEPTEPESKP